VRSSQNGTKAVISVGEEKDITFSPVIAGGKRDPHLIRIAPLGLFPGDGKVKAGHACQGLDERESGGCFVSVKLRGESCINRL